MSKTFRPWAVEQRWLLPPSVEELVPVGHLAHFVRETVRESLDLGKILSTYSEERGYPPYHPAMMTALLLYAYCEGVYSSRRIARGCEERVDFMAVTALQKPDFRTVSDFRKRHLTALGDLFVQVLKLCRRAGLATLGHVSLDGTKVAANASKHKAMSYQRMGEAEAKLAAEVAEWFRKADAADEAEDQTHGASRRGDELPAWVANKQHRLEKIRAAKQALEAEARRKSEDDPDPNDGAPQRGRPRVHPQGEPKPTDQRNFTDPDSRIMKGHDGFVQAYNCQAAVDAGSQVIVATGLTNSAADVNQLPPMLAKIRENLGRQARELSADAGYCSETNLREIDRRRIRGYVATGRQAHGAPSATVARGRHDGPRARAMARRLRQGGFRSRYRRRKTTVEPVFGQIKEARGFRRFLLRGQNNVTHEWDLICTAHNLRKLSRACRG